MEYSIYKETTKVITTWRRFIFLTWFWVLMNLIQFHQVIEVFISDLIWKKQISCLIQKGNVFLNFLIKIRAHQNLWKIHQPYIENYVQQTLGSRLKFHISENNDIFFICSSLTLCLFNVKIFALRSFHCLIIARTSNWSLFQNLMVI